MYFLGRRAVSAINKYVGTENKRPGIQSGARAPPRTQILCGYMVAVDAMNVYSSLREAYLNCASPELWGAARGSS